MAKAPAFQFYAKDFLTGTLTLSLAERGAYVTLLAYQWDVGVVPLEDAALIRILGCSRQEFRALWPAVSAKFERADDGYRNPRLEDERQRQAAFAARQRENGRRGGHSGSRQNNPRPNPGLTRASDLAVAKSNPNESSSICSLHSSEREREEAPAAPPPPSRPRMAPALAGSLPRDFLTAGFIGARFSVAEKTLADFARRYHVDPAVGRAAVVAWLRELDASLGPEDSPGGRFWVEDQFEAWLITQGKVKAPPKVRPQRAEDDLTAVMDALDARPKGRPA